MSSTQTGEAAPSPLRAPPKSAARLFLGYLLFAILWAALRLPWLSSDGGISFLWEYGFNATDEGYYLYGGKAKYLWGAFISAIGPEAFTFGHSALTHLLAYLGHVFFGLSAWAWRLPFVAINFAAWSALYFHAAHRTRARTAFVLCALFSLVPTVIAYERVAANDVLVASLTVLAYVLAGGRTVARLAGAAVCAAAIAFVKPSVWLLLPIVFAGVMQTPKTNAKWKDAALFAGLFAGAWLVGHLFVRLLLLPDAAAAGVSVSELLRRTTTFNPMIPPLFPLSAHFKAVSAFPRDPGCVALGATAVMMTAFPLWAGLARVWRRRFDGVTLFFFAVPFYVLSAALVNNVYTHYFLPALMLQPVLWTLFATAGTGDPMPQTTQPTRRGNDLLAQLADIAFTVVFLAAWAALVMSHTPSEASPYYSRIYNTLFHPMPKHNVWFFTAPYALVFALLSSAAFATLNRVRRRGTLSVPANVPAAGPVFPSALLGFGVALAALPASCLDGTAVHPAGRYLATMFVSALACHLFFSDFAGSRVCRILPFLLVVLGLNAATVWPTALRELLAPGTHVKAQTAAAVAKLVPKNALVVGERTNDLLMSAPIQTATTFPTAGDPVPVLDAARKQNPGRPVYMLMPMNPQNLNYRKILEQDRYQLVKVKCFRLPSFKDGKPEDVWLCHVIDKARADHR